MRKLQGNYLGWLFFKGAVTIIKLTTQLEEVSEIEQSNLSLYR